MRANAVGFRSVVDPLVVSLRARQDEKEKAARAAKGKEGEAYEERTKDELYNLARQRHIDGRSSMNKQELIDALRG